MKIIHLQGRQKTQNFLFWLVVTLLAINIHKLILSKYLQLTTRGIYMKHIYEILSKHFKRERETRIKTFQTKQQAIKHR